MQLAALDIQGVLMRGLSHFADLNILTADSNNQIYIYV